MLGRCLGISQEINGTQYTHILSLLVVGAKSQSQMKLAEQQNMCVLLHGLNDQTEVKIKLFSLGFLAFLENGFT